MVDTVKTIADMLIDLADNNTHEITPQDLRNLAVSLEAISPTVPISGGIVAQGVGAGDFYINGYYDFPLADANLTQAAPTQVYGTALSSYGAHASVVAGGVGTTDGSDLVLTVSGTSVTDDGVRTPADSEVVVANCLTAAANDYYETVKKWLGPVTYTLTSTGGGTFTFNFNYGLAAYEDLGNTNFKINNFSFEWYSGATDAGFDIEVHHHKTVGWTYHATAFEAGAPAIYKLSTDYSTDSALVGGDYGRWKRTNLSDVISGSTVEGVVVHITTTVNNSIQWLFGSVNVKIQP